MAIDRFDYLNDLEKISLNDLLDQLEIDLGHLGQLDSNQAHQMLLKMDAAAHKINAMRTANNPVAAESAQFDYLVSSTSQNCHALLHDLGGRDALDRLRQANGPLVENIWWFPDRTYDLRLKKTVRRIIFTTVILILVLGALFVVYNQFLKPDPIVAARYNREMQVDEALAKQDFPGALIVVNQAIDLGGNTTPMLLLRGVLETIMGRTEQAGLDFNVAEAEFNDRSSFLTARSEAWLKAGQFDFALKDASDAIQLDPSSVQALFYYGKANEIKLNYSVALDAYKKASDLAEQQGKSELNATIRITMAMLMQSSMAQMPTAVETPPSR